VLSIPDLTIPSGIHWIKGANGSGKSTLLKSMAGILPFRGDILLENNISLKNSPIPYRRLVNFAEAEPLYPEFLTGEEMIRLFMDAKSAEHMPWKFIESMRLNDFIAQPVGTYSNGTLKKLSLVFAFIGVPKIILLDEPFITLDHDATDALYKWIRVQHAESGTTFIIASHQEVGLPDVNCFLLENHILIAGE
jgi:ABC-2 type transport system ATP-binding protein